MSAALRLDRVSFRYPRREVLRDVSVEVERGERFALVGPNGSGKSTLLRLLSGVERPAGGTITIGGRDLASIPPRELARAVAVVPQETAIDFPFSVHELVLMGRSPHLGRVGFEGERDLAAAEEALRSAGVADLRERPFPELSGGEKQRVVIARALAQEPEILLLDEPTTFLDIRHVVEIFDLLTELSTTQGITLFVVLHDLNLAALYCQRIGFLKEGRLLAAGPTEEVLTYDNIRRTFETDVYVDLNDLTGKLNVLPLPKQRS